MTPAQLATFKAAVLAEPALAALRTAGDQGGIAAYYNAQGASSVWRPVITIAELNTAIVWSEFIALTQGQRDAYMALISAPSIDATKTNVRNGFASIFAATSLANLTALAQRLGTRFELLFTTAQVSAVFGQVVSPADVAAAMET